MLKRLLPATAALLALSLLAACGNEADNDEAVDSTTGASTPADSPTRRSRPPPAPPATTPRTAPEPAKPVDPPPAEATATGTLERHHLHQRRRHRDRARRRPDPVHGQQLHRRWPSRATSTTPSATGSPPRASTCCSAATRPPPAWAVPATPSPTRSTARRSTDPGVLAMAKTGHPDSGGSQFFLVYADSGVLRPCLHRVRHLRRGRRQAPRGDRREGHHRPAVPTARPRTRSRSPA